MATLASRIQAELFYYSYSIFFVLVWHTHVLLLTTVIFGDYIQTHWAPGTPSSFQSYQFSRKIPPCSRHGPNSCILHMTLLLLLFSLLSFQNDVDHFLLPRDSISFESWYHLYIIISHLPPVLHEVWLSVSSCRTLLDIYLFTHLHLQYRCIMWADQSASPRSSVSNSEEEKITDDQPHSMLNAWRLIKTVWLVMKTACLPEKNQTGLYIKWLNSFY